MPTFTFTSPDGKNYDVQGPDGATKEQAFQILQAQLKQSAPQTPQPQEQPQSPIPDVIKRVLGGAARGMLTAGPIGAIMNAGNQVMNAGQGVLDKAGYAAGGGVTDIASSLGASPELAAGLGAGANVVVSQGPGIVAGGEIGKLAAPSLQSASRELMQSALKPSVKALQNGSAGKAIDTLLKEGVNVSSGGVEKLQSKIDVLNDKVTQALQSSNATVDKKLVATRIQDVISRIERTNPTPQDAVKDVEKVYDQFLSNKLLPNDIPVKQAQELKTGIYRVLKDAYGMISSDTKEAQKALARGFKEEIAAKVPAVRPLNEEESKLLNALSLTERRVLVSANKNPLSFAALMGNPARMATFMADRSELFKSIVARMLNAGSEQVPANVGRLGMGAAGIAQQQQ